MTDIATFIPIIGFLVAITNIIVQVLKKAFYDKLHTNVVVIVVAEILSNAFGIAYCQINNITSNWYTVISFIVIGFMVSYAAMFGYDKLKEIINWRK